MKALQYEETEKGLALVLPARIGQILWYIHGEKLWTARVYEIKATVSSSGYCCEDVVVFAWNPMLQRQLTWCPLHEEGWLDARDEYVPIYDDRCEAIMAMNKLREEKWKHADAGGADDMGAADRGDGTGTAVGGGGGSLCHCGTSGEDPRSVRDDE